jgi:lysozyme
MRIDLFRPRALRSLALSALALIALAGCGTGVANLDRGSYRDNVHFTGPHPEDFAVHGVDVSKYQGEIDWSAVKASGVRFAWIKSTEGGDHMDEKFLQNWQNAKAAGVPRGAYHFVYWCRPPLEEMAWFKQVVPVEPDALPPVLDVEATPTSRTCKRKLQRDEVLRDMRIMLEDMERHYGKRPVIYSTVDFYQSILQPNEMSDYQIWVRSTKNPPHVPYGPRKWAFWQYQSDGYVPGIRGKVDRNAFAGGPVDWQAFLDGRYSARPSL